MTREGAHPRLQVVLPEVPPDRRRQRGNFLILRRCDESRMVGELAKRISICSKQSAKEISTKKKSRDQQMAPTEVSKSDKPTCDRLSTAGKPVPNVQRGSESEHIFQ